jgi:hypothetical protein
MDYFLAICQALGIALAVGALAGASGRGGRAAALVALLAAAAGGLSMSADSQPIAGGIAVGAVGGWLAARAVSALVSGAARRAEGAAGGVSFVVALAAVVLAGLSIVAPPVSLAAVLALGWLVLARRRRAQRKYEGLRILR